MKKCCRCQTEYPATTEYFSRCNGLKDGLTSQCKKCRKDMWAASYQQHRDKRIASSTLSTQQRRKCADVRERERYLSREAKRRLLKTEEGRRHHNALQSTWRKNNPESVKKFKHQRPEQKAYRQMVRYARKKNAMPPWANKAQILSKYEAARRVTEETGIPHEVDHIIPLAGVNVCGLHVGYNLRVIPAVINRIKGNKLII